MDKSEQQIDDLKQIVSSYLEKIAEQKVIADNEQYKFKLLKKDLDDFKAGRLDKIEDRQNNDPRVITVINIQRVVDKYIPMQPWRSSYVLTNENTTLIVTGVLCQNFVSGIYRVRNKTINL